MRVGQFLAKLTTALVVSLLACCHATQAADQKTFYVVRHAEKADNTGDPGLSERGQARANDLNEILKRLGGVQATYATDARRTRETARPSTPMGTNPRTYVFSRDRIESVANDGHEKRVLIVGHSDTVHKIVAALSQVPETDVAVTGDSYDALFIVTIESNRRAYVRLRYGNESQ